MGHSNKAEAMVDYMRDSEDDPMDDNSLDDEDESSAEEEGPQPGEKAELNGSANGVKPQLPDCDDVNKAVLHSSDPFVQHFERIIPKSLALDLLSPAPAWTRQSVKLPELGDAVLSHPQMETPPPGLSVKERDLRKMRVRRVLCERAACVNSRLIEESITPEDPLTPLQRSLFAVMNRYQAWALITFLYW